MQGLGTAQPFFYFRLLQTLRSLVEIDFTMRITLLVFLCVVFLPGCKKNRAASQTIAQSHNPLPPAFIDSVTHRTFNFFWDLADSTTGNQPDRWPSKSFSSIAATGFGLTAYLIGVDHEFITRQQAAERVLKTLR